MQKILTSLIHHTHRRWFFFYLTGFILILTLRLFNIHSIPAVISHDEIYYPAEARAIAVSGHDPAGTWVPWSLTSAHPLYAELPGLVMTPAAILFSDPLLAARITHVLVGSLFCLVLSAFMYSLTENKYLAAITFGISAVNPWLFQFSRMGFDALLSLFFFFSGLTLYLRLPTYKKLWSLPFLFLGFFQYQGLKVIFVPLILGTVFFEYWVKTSLPWQKYLSLFKKRNTLPKHIPALIVAVFSVVLFGSYMVRLSNQAAGERSTDLIFSDTAYTTTHTNTDRQQSLNSPLTKVFINKGTVLFDRFISQYFESFSWHHLFITGEPLRNPFSVWKHGIFYLPDVILIFLGAVYLLKHSDKKYHKIGWYLLFLVLIAPLAGAVNAKGSWIMFRSSLLIPTGILLISFGAWFLYTQLPRLVFALLVVLYSLFVARFFFLYFYSYPIIGTQGEYFSERIVANYIERNPDKKIIVYASEPRFMFETVLVFNNLITKETIASITTAYQEKKYSLDNFLITNTCYQPQADSSVVSIVNRATPTCDGSKTEKASTDTAIPSLIDSGAIYRLYNDSLCSGYPLGTFSHISTNNFYVEKLTNTDFCSSFFTRE